MNSEPHKWGVFEDFTGRVHVAPIDKHGRLLPGHALTHECECRPKEDRDAPWHKIPGLIHRGDC